MFSFAKIIGLLAVAATFISMALGVDTLAGAQDLARREVSDYANVLIVDGIKVAGRQFPPTTVTTTVTVQGSDCGSFTTTVTPPTTVATTTSETTVTPGSDVSSTTSVPSMSVTPTDTIPAGSSETSTVETTTPAAPAPSTTAPAGSASVSSEVSSIISSNSMSISASDSGISVPPPSPTGPTTTSPSPSHTTGNTNGAGLTMFNVIGALAAVGVAAFAVY